MARDLTSKIEQLRAQLQQTEALARKQERAADRNRKIIVGAVILKEMENSPELRSQIVALLDQKITSKRDREIVQPWLVIT